MAEENLNTGATLVSHDPPEPSATEPPVVVDAPYAEQRVDVLNCTMGNWQNEPETYNYQWKCDGAVVGHGADYPIALSDAGKSYSCLVTAANAAGQASSESNVVVVA